MDYKNVHTRYKDYLCHHGIRGQKWGIRRYQNPDGTLTELGKKRKQMLTDASKYAKKSAASLNTTAKEQSEYADKIEKLYPTSMSRQSHEIVIDGNKWKSSATIDQTIKQLRSDAQKNRDLAQRFLEEADVFLGLDIADISPSQLAKAKEYSRLYFNKEM